MNRVAVVCLEDDRAGTVSLLRELGSVHLTPEPGAQSEELVKLLRERDHIQRARTVLRARNVEHPAAEPATADLSVPGVIAKALDLTGEMARHQERLSHWRKVLGQLEPWGSFSSDLVAEAREYGLQIVLSRASEKAMPEIPDGATLHIASRSGKTVYFAVVAPVDVELDLPEIPIPELTEDVTIDARIAGCVGHVERCQRELDELAAALPRIDDKLALLSQDIEFLEARDGMGCAPGLCYLQGFVPDSRLPALKDAATKHGWAVQTTPVPQDDLEAPTSLKLPHWLEVSKPIFSFIGILPAYNEPDVSFSVLVFLSIFFGMIVGDAGYGIIFLVLSGIAKVKIRAPEKQLTLNLFLIFSLITFAWGGLSGNYFAIPLERLPKLMQGCRWLTDGATKDGHVQWLCFFIGAAHLSLGRCWQAAIRMGRRDAFGHIGWGLLIWGNFFTAVELVVYKGSFPTFAYGLYIVGALLIFGCGVNWRSAGDVMNLPFGFVGSFVDVLSYIRLFAVGLSSYFIAASFNSMGKMVYDLSPWLIIPAVLVILFGHLLNVILGFMGVLVHGIRLNTLEFSNHMGLTWSGKPYQPFSHRTV